MFTASTDEGLTVETIGKYERRVEDIEVERKRQAAIKRFERRIEEIEAHIRPQLDEIRALKEGLNRLRQGPEVDRGARSAVVNGRPHANMAGPTAAQATPARRRR